MKKILVIHNKYRIFGGEDSNISDEIRILEKNNNVEYLEFDNSEKLKIIDLLFFAIKSNFISNKILKKKLIQFKPDYVYIHNTWFRANLGLFSVLQKHQINTILKIHNFRYECTKYFTSKNHLKSFNQCPMCGYNRSGLFNKYFLDSFLKSFFMILYGKKYFKILVKNNIQLLVLNSFHYDKLISHGIPKSKIKIAYNPIYLDPNLKNIYNPKSQYILYAGSLTDSKGILQLIETWNKFGSDNLKLKIAGDGKLKEFVKLSSSQRLEYLGVLENFETLNLIKHARAVISFTNMYEGQPRILNEAASYGVPSIFPNFGGMIDYFPDNYLLAFDQFDYKDALNKLNYLNDEDQLKKISKEISSFVNAKFREDKLLTMYKDIFSD